MKDDTTAKRLRNAAQGCRASRLPWVTGSSDNNPTGVAAVVDLDQLYKSPLDFDSFRFDRETQPRWGLHPC